ncbi:MAG: autotransporter assembly complex family protein [Rhodothalassiaceae bacterium]
MNGGLRELLLDVSTLRARQDEPPATFAGLKQRLNQDLDTFARALNSEGYYGHRLLQRIDRAADPAQVIVEVLPGPRYRLDAVTLDFGGQDIEGMAQIREDLDLTIGAPATAQRIIAAQTRLERSLPRHGYPLADMRPRRVVVDHATQAMRVTYRAAPGPRLAFGDLDFTGADRVDREFLRRLIPWQEGELFDADALEAYRRTVSRTGLFGLVEIAYGAPQDGRLPMTLQLTAAEHRTVSVAAKYSTSEGPSVEVTWEHRNFLGQGERFDVTGVLAELEQGLRIGFDKPHFRRPNQDLLLGLELIREDTDAFEALRATLLAGLQRPFGEQWIGNAGVELEVSQIDDKATGQETFFILGALPVSARFDATDNLLDPRQGARVTVRTIPHIVDGDSVFGFFKGELIASGYIPIDDEERYIVALRTRIGSITGVDTLSIPATRRFFAGGGGSVRGFEFQEVGPEDADGNPIGGRSVIEYGVELRWRAFGNFGIVPFVDAGNVFFDSVPRLDRFGSLRYGAGIGVRYYTGFGPIRLDVATPIDRREGEFPVQVYISIGQSF